MVLNGRVFQNRNTATLLALTAHVDHRHSQALVTRQLTNLRCVQADIEGRTCLEVAQVHFP
jgi:hypothetical protein